MKGRIFAIGDIHGCSETFKKLLLDKIRIQKNDKIYCIGDYIDRGKDSKGVVDFILKLRNQGYHIHTLRGNHEEIMFESTKSEKNFQHWIKNGGDTTLKSFGVSSFDEMKPVYKNFFKRTKFFIKSGNFIFVHAGLNFQIQNPFEDKKAMLWLRKFPVDYEKLGENIIIHGHTPEGLESILQQEWKGAINIDGGCVYKLIDDFGNLVALNVTDREFIRANNIER